MWAATTTNPKSPSRRHGGWHSRGRRRERGRRGPEGRTPIPVEHADQQPADRGLELGPIPSNLDLPVRIPGVPQSPRPVERESRCREPLEPEGLAPDLRLARGAGTTARDAGRVITDRAFRPLVVLAASRTSFFGRVFLPKHRPTGRVVDDAAPGGKFSRFCHCGLGRLFTRRLRAWRERDSGRRVVVDGRRHPGVAKVLARFVR